MNSAVHLECGKGGMQASKAILHSGEILSAPRGWGQ